VSNSGLSGDIAEAYRSFGVAGPYKAFEPAELDGMADRVMREMGAQNFNLLSGRNRHLDWDLAQRLSAAPAIREAAFRLLGPRLALWRTQFFVGRRGQGLRWHQDEYRTLLRDPFNHISIHLAITEAVPDNCVFVLPGSHRMDRAELARQGFHFLQGTDEDAYGAPNYWRDASRPTNDLKMTLRPGEFFVFHPGLVHASKDMTGLPLAPRPPSLMSDLARRVSRRLVRARDIVSMPRLAFGLRLTVAENEIFPTAFAQTLPRPDHAVMIEAGAPA
jgi:hypothetical protein